MAQAQWPDPSDRQHIGKRINRLDGPIKSTGAAKYAFDINRPEMLYAKILGSEYASATIRAVDTSAASALPGVESVWVHEELIGGSVEYVGQVIAAVAAQTEEIAADAIRRIKVDYEPKPHNVIDTDPSLREGRPSTREQGDVEAAFRDADAVVEGSYGLAIITHCCLEAHGQVAEVRDGELYLWPSTQNVSRYTDRLDVAVGIEQSKMHVDCQHMGGGFGAKFSHDQWGVISALMAKETGKPVKLMLDRDLEQMIAGNRPSAYSKVKVGVKNDGTVIAVQSDIWGSGGMGGFGALPVPYVFTGIANTALHSQGIRTNRGGPRAWRAPNHPQACLITMAALDDAAAAIGMDALDFFKHNAQFTDRPDVYRRQFDIAADMIGYRQKAHLRGEGGNGPIKRGLGLSCHTWGGRGHPSECDCTIRPDGSVEVRMGTQDLGVGTRTVIAIVTAETLGLPLDAVKVNIGKNEYPESGGSGGSTTVGGISASSLLASTAALNALFEIAAPRLNVAPDALEAKGGQVREKANPGNAMAWKDACGLLGTNSITKRGVNNPGESQQMGLIDQGVGGVQIAEVSVDVETGVVTLEEMVAVQDCGLVVSMKTAESQVEGGLIMGITFALYEEAVYDPVTGRMLNAEMEFYRLAGLKDVGKLKVHMMTDPEFEKRGVIGLGEPPVISPGAAISNAVANAIGVRVPHLPLTPDRVIAALEHGGIA